MAKSEKFFPDAERAAFPAMYAMLYPGLVKVANGLGYALALHGSLSRDMDLLAVPWTEEAPPAEELVAALREKLGRYADYTVEGINGPHEKPHGRRAWSILLWGHGYIDLSVMPRLSPST